MKWILFFGLGVILSIKGTAQSGANKDSLRESFYLNKIKFFNRVTSDPFPPIGKWKDVKGEEFNFNEINRPAIIRFGFRGCAPCKFEMKTFIQLSKEYKDVDFLYVTFDSPEEISEDIKTHYPDMGRMRFFSVPKTYINAYRLAFGYPMTYFLNSPNDVLHVEGGGRTDNDSIVHASYRHAINSIFTR